MLAYFCVRLLGELKIVLWIRTGLSSRYGMEKSTISFSSGEQVLNVRYAGGHYPEAVLNPY